MTGMEPWMETGLKVAAIIVVVLAAQLAIRQAATTGIRRLLERRAAARETTPASQAELDQRIDTLQRLAVRVTGLILLVIAVLMILGLFDINIAPALAGLGVVGIAVGFGAQALFRDWLAGIFIVIENQYSVGDVVTIAGVSGLVEDISMRRTLLRDLNGAVHTVPNGQIEVASNLTSDWARVNLDIGVAYDTDIDRATEVINQIGTEMAADETWKERLLEPPAVLRVNSLDDSSVTLKVLGRVLPAEQWGVAGELRRRILRAFASAGIEIPFPHRVIIRRGDGSGSESD
jgi:small conductance mechanosensitive channel